MTFYNLACRHVRQNNTIVGLVRFLTPRPKAFDKLFSQIVVFKLEFKSAQTILELDILRVRVVMDRHDPFL